MSPSSFLRRRAPRHTEPDATSLLAELAALSGRAWPSAAAALDTYLQFTNQALGVQSSFVGQIDSQSLHILRVVGQADCQIATDEVIPLVETFCQYVRANAVPVSIPDVAHDPRVQTLPAGADGTIGAYLGVPLLAGNGLVIGTLCALDPQPRPFSPLAINLLQVVARQISLLLEVLPLAQPRAAVPLAEAEPENRPDPRAALLQVVAQTLRTPMSTIQGYADLLAGTHARSAEVRQEAAAAISRAAQFINRLTTDLIDMAKADQGSLTLLVSRVDVAEIAQEVVSACQHQAEARGLSLQMDGAPPLPQVICDADRLRQVLLNVVQHALEATAYGQVRVHLAAESNGVRIGVQAYALTCASGHLEHVWQLQHGWHTDGGGLGLFLAQRLVQAMGGTVGVDNAPETGYALWVQLPQQGPQPQQMIWHRAN